MGAVRIGTAGWTIPRFVADAFPMAGTGLQRYAARFRAVEINSTFYRSHRPSTYERWRTLTPPDFRFAVKTPKAITHAARLVDCEALLEAFIEEVEAGLGDKLGPLLVQLPPSLAFDAGVADAFFNAMGDRTRRPVVCEPRHASWFEPAAEAFLAAHEVARAAADPARHAEAGAPGGWRGLAYWRLHGSPRMYYSSYPDEALVELAAEVRNRPGEAWVVFDNTTSGAAAANALRLSRLLDGDSG